MKLEGVGTVIADQCMYGLKTRSEKGKSAKAKKPTRFMSISEEIRKQLNKRCHGSHTHQQLLGGRAKGAAIYPPTVM